MKIKNHIIFHVVSILLMFQLSGLITIQAQSKNENEGHGFTGVNESSSPPGSYQLLSSTGKVSIPFEMYRNKIRMTAQVNGKNCYLTIDNGSLWDEILFFGSPTVDSLGFSYHGETIIGDTAVANLVRADIADHISIAFNDIIFIEQTAIVTRYDRRFPSLWAGIDGQVSATFFKHFIVTINFDESVIELMPPPSFSYSGAGQMLEMKPGPNHSRTITAELTMPDDATTTIDLLVDLGGIYPLYLPLGKNDQITLHSNALAAQLGAGFMRQNGYVGRVKTMRLGKYALQQVLTAFTPVIEEADSFGNTMIGLPLLQRFNIIFDYFQNRMILEPAKSFHDPFTFNLTGLEFIPDRQGHLKVITVYPNSPSAEKQIKVDDIITHVNGNPVSAYKPGELRSILIKEGASMTLDILRNDQTQKITIVLRDVL